MTKAIAARIKNVLPDIVHCDQTGYVKDRSIKCMFKHILKFLTTPTHEKSPQILNFPVKIKQNPKFNPKF